MSDPRLTPPRMAHKIWWWVADRMLDDVDWSQWNDDDEQLATAVADAVKGLLCERYGHEVIDDQCGIPSHRYCVYCNRGMPDMPVGRVEP